MGVIASAAGGAWRPAVGAVAAWPPIQSTNKPTPQARGRAVAEARRNQPVVVQSVDAWRASSAGYELLRGGNYAGREGRALLGETTAWLAKTVLLRRFTCGLRWCTRADGVM